jgi:hypothetical protein
MSQERTKSLAERLAGTRAALRIALARIARGADDGAHALSLLVLLRAARASNVKSIVQITEQARGTLVSIENGPGGGWIGDVVPVSMQTVLSVLADQPELASTFARFYDDDGAVVLRAIFFAPPAPPARPSQRATLAEHPSLELLVEAGLAPREALDTR